MKYINIVYKSKTNFYPLETAKENVRWKKF